MLHLESSSSSSSKCQTFGIVSDYVFIITVVNYHKKGDTASSSSSENGDGSSEDCDRSSDSNASKTSTFVSRLSSYSFSLSLRSNGVLSTFLDP